MYLLKLMFIHALVKKLIVTMVQLLQTKARMYPDPTIQKHKTHTVI